MLEFKKLELEDKKLIDSYFRNNRYEGAECTFTNLYMWQECFQIAWVEINEFLCLKAEYEGKTYLIQPYGNDEKGLAEVVQILVKYMEEQGYPFLMRGITAGMKEKLEKLYPQKFSFKSEREIFDYVYLVDDLVNLKGRKFHRKRNHIKNFKKNYGHYRFEPLTEELIEPCIESLKEWCRRKNCDKDKELICERDAIIRAFLKFKELDYIGGVYYIDNEIEAFTFGEKLNNDTVVIHAEKANIDFNGIYPAINQEFLKEHWTQMKYVNREEDLGREGLRKAKLSYFPTMLIEKYIAELS